MRLGRKRIPVEEGDTVASALYRAGIRTFSRSLKYHRRRGLYCGTGECPNCLLTVDGVPGVRSCVTPALEGMRLRREHGWPSVERDALSILDRLHVLLPVGFYYKTFIHPRWLWGVADRIIRRAVGLGRLPSGPVERRTARHLHCDVLVVGAGSSGRAAAVTAAAGDERVVLCDEGDVSDPPAGMDVLPRHAAIGIYEGPMVALASANGIVQVHPRRVVAATGGVEVHPVFPGNDLPGVMLGRAAAGLAERGVMPGRRAVVVVGHDEGIEHLRSLQDAGVRIAAAVVPASLAARVPEGIRTMVGAEVLRADGKHDVRFAVLRDAEGVTRGIGCDLFVLSVGLWPRDDLVRMAGPDAVEVVGDASIAAQAVPESTAGTVCLCEDVSIADLERAWAEGYRSSELSKRYTTATMGPCQGAMCGRHLAAFAATRNTTATADTSARTTARPPARPVPLGTLAAAVHPVIEKRTSLHDAHVAAGARMGWSGSWLRPFDYGDASDEYRAVRERVSVMDVGTLAKFLVTGPDATHLMEVAFPARFTDVAPGRSRYLLALDEAGYVFDDGLACALGEEGWYLTSTSGGADRMEAWLRDHADRRGLRAHVIDLTAERGAIVVAGPLARALLGELTDAPLDAETFPPLGIREVRVAGVLVRRDPERLRRRGVLRAPSSAVARPRPLDGARRGRCRVRPPSARARRARDPPAREGTSLRRAGHAPGRHAGEARPRPCRGSRGELRGLPRARAPRGSLDRPEARRPRVRSRGRGAPRRAVADRRADPGEGDLGGMEPDPGAIDRSRVDPPGAGRRVPRHAPRRSRHRSRRSHAVPRPGGSAPPWLSSGPSTRTRMPASSRCARRARAGWRRTRCSFEAPSRRTSARPC